MAAYEAVVDEAEDAVFGGMTLPAALSAMLRDTVLFLYQKDWFHPQDHARLVIAGMGEAEAFPVLIQYSVGALAAGALRYRKDHEARCGGEEDAFVVPFAQDDLIHTVINGIHPRIHREVIERAVRWTPNGVRPKTEKDEAFDAREAELAELLHEIVLAPYFKPFMEAVSALPRQDLARMAEALVNLTAFLMHMTADEDETVAEPIDVALLSKGDGFVWFRHKEVGR